MNDDPLVLLRLLQVSDSNFPSGGFAFSNGLETLANEGALATANDVEAFLRGHLLPRWVTFDRWFVVRAWESDGEFAALKELDWHCEAQSSVQSLGYASRRMGRAVLTSHERMGTPQTADYLKLLHKDAAPGHLPVVQGMVAWVLGLPRAVVEVSSVYQLANGVLCAALRLGKIGALQAQAVQASIAPDIVRLLSEPLPALPHAFAPLADIAAMRHGDGGTRLFAA